MDLSIHRLKARSSRFSVTAIAFLNVGPADSICVAVSEKNFICATVPISDLLLKIETAETYRRCRSERFNACPIFRNGKIKTKKQKRKKREEKPTVLSVLANTSSGSPRA
jgi:hypothetical protein